MRKEIVDEFSHLQVSRQRKQQLRNKRDGKCPICSRPLHFYSSLCDTCRDKARERARAKLGHNAWRPGAVGRPPTAYRHREIAEAKAKALLLFSKEEAQRLVGWAVKAGLITYGHTARQKPKRKDHHATQSTTA